MARWVAHHAAPRSRTFWRRRGAASAVAGGVVVTVCAVTAVALTFPRSAPAADDGCGPQDRPLQVTAAPEIAPIVSAVVRVTWPSGPCPAPTVTAADPAATANALAHNLTDRPDVWIPDSSLRLQLSPDTAGLPAAGQATPSVARSPLVLAVPVGAAGKVAATLAGGQGGRSLTVADVVSATTASGGPVRWAFTAGGPSDGSVVTVGSVGAVLALRSSLSGRSDGPAVLTSVLRSAARDIPAGPAEATLTAAASAGAAVAVTEQQLWSNPASSLWRAAYPVTGATSFDYPFVDFATERSRRAQADRLLDVLRGDLGRQLLTAAGFRDASGTAGPALGGRAGIDPTRPGAPPVPSRGALASAVDTFAQVTRGSRLLTVIDVSGSMATSVPGAGGATRLDLAVRAATGGLALYSDDTVAGLWTFSTNLTRRTDYAALVPPVPLGRGADGSSGRQRLATALAQVRVRPHGGTALYDTVLAAVRAVRAGWDPTRVNSVVIITDGANDDPRGLDLPRLITLLADEKDATKPVPVFAIAYGPSADTTSLKKIAAATGGRLYAAADPRNIGAVMLDAIGRRA